MSDTVLEVHDSFVGFDEIFRRAVQRQQTTTPPQQQPVQPAGSEDKEEIDHG